MKMLLHVLKDIGLWSRDSPCKLPFVPTIGSKWKHISQAGRAGRLAFRTMQQPLQGGGMNRQGEEKRKNEDTLAGHITTNEGRSYLWITKIIPNS